MERSPAAFWCRKKEPITPAALKAVGARMGRYRKQWPVIAIPINGKDGKPVGWCMYALNGGKLPRFEGQRIVELIKVKNTYGSQPGVIEN